MLRATYLSQKGSVYLQPLLRSAPRKLHAEPHVRPISCHVTSLTWQESEEELNKLLLMKVSDRDRNVKVKMLVVCEVIVIIID